MTGNRLARPRCATACNGWVPSVVDSLERIEECLALFRSAAYSDELIEAVAVAGYDDLTWLADKITRHPLALPHGELGSCCVEAAKRITNSVYLPGRIQRLYKSEELRAEVRRLVEDLPNRNELI